MDMTWNHNFSEEMTKKQVQVQEIPGNSAWGLRQSQHGSQTPLLHTSSSSSSVKSCFRSNFHEPAANRLLQNVRYHCIMHCIMHIMHHIASYWIILDHIGSQENFCRLSSCAEGEQGKAAHNTNHIGPRGSGTSQSQSPGFSRNIGRNTESVRRTSVDLLVVLVCGSVGAERGCEKMHCIDLVELHGPWQCHFKRNIRNQWRWGDEWRAEYPGTLPWRTAAVRMRASTWATRCRLKVRIFEDFSGWTHIWIMNIYQNLSIWIFEYIINNNNIFINYCHSMRTGQFTTYHQISQIIARTQPNLPCFN